MILAFLVALPLCIGVAGWIVDATFQSRARNEQPVSRHDEWIS